MDTNEQSRPYNRTDEEVAWDAEFGTPGRSRTAEIPGVIADLAKLAVQVPIALVQMPMALLPNDTARHARAAVREGFLAVRSLFSAIADGVEGLLSDPSGGRQGREAGCVHCARGSDRRQQRARSFKVAGTLRVPWRPRPTIRWRSATAHGVCLLLCLQRRVGRFQHRSEAAHGRHLIRPR